LNLNAAKDKFFGCYFLMEKQLWPELPNQN
jgi:hypothetical protein